MKILDSLSEGEYLLVLATNKAAMADLDEEQLLAMHARVRRARNKYVSLYRRAGAAKVKQKRARGSAEAANTRNAAKAEVFEDALGRVSRQLAVAARRSALELKEERLALARTDAPTFADGHGSKSKALQADSNPATVARKSGGRKKLEASTKAVGARRQAKKDAR